MPRQTGMSLKEIISELPTAVNCGGGQCEAGPGYPAGLLVNEVGAIFESGSEESVEAEQLLAKLLTSERKGSRWIAWRYLCETKREMSPATIEALRAFRGSPMNSEFFQ